jgi:hypothetical protein
MKKWLILAAALVGMWVCVMLGYRAGSTKAADFFFRQEMSSNLVSLHTDIKVAGFLKANQKEKAEELLENVIDAHVSSLGVQVNQKPYAPIRQEILQAIHEAKAYRTKWTSPEHRVNENLKRGVNAAFAMQ